MGAVVLPAQSDPSHPFVDKPGTLPSADMIAMINPAREGVVVESAASTFEPGEGAGTGGLEELELNGRRVFCSTMMARERTRPPLTRSADLDRDDVAPAQLAVDREIELRAIA